MNHLENHHPERIPGAGVGAPHPGAGQAPQRVLAATGAWLAGLVARARGEQGFSTAELLGNAALGILALVVIWGLMQALGVDIVNWIRSQLLAG